MDHPAIEKKSASPVKRWHYFSGLTLSLFIALHLFNQLASLAGPASHVRIMEVLRAVYRNPFVETILLLAVVSQVITGMGLLFNKQQRSAGQKIQIWSGMYLSFFLLAHVAGVLYGRYAGLDTNFNYAAVGLNYFPATFYFIPYYFFAVAAISLHISALHYNKTQSMTGAALIAGIGITAAILIIGGFTNWFQWRDVPIAYQQFIKAFFGGT